MSAPDADIWGMDTTKFAQVIREWGSAVTLTFDHPLDGRRGRLVGPKVLEMEDGELVEVDSPELRACLDRAFDRQLSRRQRADAVLPPRVLGS